MDAGSEVQLTRAAHRLAQGVVAGAARNKRRAVQSPGTEIATLKARHRQEGARGPTKDVNQRTKPINVKKNFYVMTKHFSFLSASRV